jgi:hypothetical protein
MPPGGGRRKEESEMHTDPYGDDAAGARSPDTRGVDFQAARGAWLRGEAPQELVLSDGTRLRLEPAEDGRVGWRRLDELEGRTRQVSTGEASELAGEFDAYVTVRTRAEAAWLRAVADWCGGEAERLERELATTA